MGIQPIEADLNLNLALDLVINLNIDFDINIDLNIDIDLESDLNINLNSVLASTSTNRVLLGWVSRSPFLCMRGCLPVAGAGEAGAV